MNLNDFFPLDVLLPLNLPWDTGRRYGTKNQSKKQNQSSRKQINRANANKDIWTCLSFPSRRHVASLLLNTKHLGYLRITLFLSILSPCRSLSLSLSPYGGDTLSPFGSDKFWWDLSKWWALMWSLSPPLTSISKKGLLEFVVNGFGPWVTTQSTW